MKRIAVAAAVIYDTAAEHILLSLRPTDKHQGGLWEFPGGKIESAETAESALCRELQEELGITPTRLQPLLTSDHDYHDKKVTLQVWTVHAFTGSPVGLEGQEIRWVKRDELANYEFPAANQFILDKLLE